MVSYSPPSRDASIFRRSHPSPNLAGDNSNVSAFLKAIGGEMPRLAIDALGGEAGKRLAIALRPGGTLVVHSLAHGQVPTCHARCDSSLLVTVM